MDPELNWRNQAEIKGQLELEDTLLLNRGRKLDGGSQFNAPLIMFPVGGGAPLHLPHVALDHGHPAPTVLARTDDIVVGEHIWGCQF